MYWGIRRSMGVRGNRPRQVEGTPQNVGLGIILEEYQGRDNRADQRPGIRS